MSAKKIDVPASLFDDSEVESGVVPSPLEIYLGRKRDAGGSLIPRKKKSRTVAASTFDRTRVETQEMIDTRDWGACAARHLVALYDLMHLKIYGIDVTMSGSERYTATLMAGGFVKRAFGGDFEKSVDYFRWAWTREKEREKWRRENGRDGGTIGLGFMFSNKLLDQYRIALVRQRNRR